MFALIIEYSILPESLEEASRIWDNYFLPMAREYSGFVAGFFMMDRKKGKATGVEIWEDKKSIKKFEQTGLLHQITTEFYELITDDPAKNYLEIGAWEIGSFAKSS